MLAGGPTPIAAMARKVVALSEADARDRVLRTCNVSRETLERLDAYIELLKKWNKAINLVGKSELKRLWARHLLDSAGLWFVAPQAGLWMDLGSGGGFPVAPLAILAHDTRPELRFEAVESDGRKAAFLAETARALELRLRIIHSRIEAVDGAAPSVISARALAALPDLLKYSDRIRNRDTALQLLKGNGWFDELTLASRNWHIRHRSQRHPLTSEGVILTIEDFAECPKTRKSRPT